MKKLLVLSIVFVMAAPASSTPYITVDGEDPGDETTIQPGDYNWIGINLSIPPYLYRKIYIAEGMDYGEWTGEGHLYHPDDIVCGPPEPFCNLWIYDPEEQSWMYPSGYESFDGVVADAEFHCEAPGDVVLELWESYYYFMDWVLVDTLTIHQSNSPQIGFSPSEISFVCLQNGDNPAPQTLSIYKNGGNGTLNWQVTESCSWLQADPNTGSSTGEPNDVTLSVDNTGLTVGMYNCDIVISDPCASNTPQTVSVSLSVYDDDGVLHVPSEYGTIQTAIDLAREGDTVLVAEGTYNENISFGGKNIILTSTDPEEPNVVSATIIDGGSVDSVVRFNGTESSDCKLLGFTITNGYGPGDDDGGGISGAGNSATVANCSIKDNIAQKHGGGIRDVNGLIDRCIITGNSTVEKNGGGLCGCDGTISNCLIYNNTATLNGGGMVMCNGDIVNCTIADNAAGVSGGGIVWCGSATITNCIIWGNNLEQIDGGSPTYSCIQDWSAGGTGNIDSNPLFVDPNGLDGIMGTKDDNLRLSAGSPCIDAGENSVVDPNGSDLDGNPRVVHGTVDMGAYEFQGITYYVDVDAGGNNNGSSWTHAFTDLQSALAEAVSEDEIRVADGTYTPSVPADPCDVRTKTFQLKNGVAIYGGYAGSGAPNPDQRDPNRYMTILNGDLAGNDGPPPDPPGLLDDPGRAENSYHVVTASGIDASAVMYGFTVTGGNANVFQDQISGGGMYNNNASPTVTNCIFRSNSAFGGGGAMCNVAASRPAVSNCTFSSNRANTGGGVVNGNLSGATVANCLFIGNWAVIHGGGMHNTIGSNPIVGNCIFSGNWAGNAGGGMCNFADSSAAVTNCTFSGNQAGNEGGGILNFTNSNTTVTNCILWADTPEEINTSAPATVKHCDIQGGWLGLGNIDANPNFADPANGDYHLKSQAGRWDSSTGNWVLDDVTSLCIDAGNPGCLLGDEPGDPDNVRINMGAYGGTAEASRTPVGWGLLADLTNDWTVNYKDIAGQGKDWQQTASCQPGDLNRDGTVNLADVVLTAADWLKVRSVAEAGMDYQIEACDLGAKAAGQDKNGLRFSATVDGNYILFEDMMVANCCPDEMWLEMEDNQMWFYQHNFERIHHSSTSAHFADCKRYSF